MNSYLSLYDYTLVKYQLKRIGAKLEKAYIKSKDGKAAIAITWL